MIYMQKKSYLHKKVLVFMQKKFFICIKKYLFICRKLFSDSLAAEKVAVTFSSRLLLFRDSINFFDCIKQFSFADIYF